MYYCEFLEDKTLIRTVKQNRVVGKYLIVNQNVLPFQISYKAEVIVRVVANGDMLWYKQRNKIDLTALTEKEQKDMLVQILKSETW